MNDHSFNIAFGVSLALHLTFLSGTFTQGQSQLPEQQLKPLKLIYEQEQSQFKLQHLEEQLARLKGLRFEMPAVKWPDPQPTIRIPKHVPSLIEAKRPEPVTLQAPTVDLTDLIDASQGDPILLNYFSSIREKIQITARKNASLLTNETTEGLVYISFILSASGNVERASVILERSINSSSLHRIAVIIIQKAAPFLPFPPSIKEARHTIIVPLDFFLGGL